MLEMGRKNTEARDRLAGYVRALVLESRRNLRRLGDAGVRKTLPAKRE
jgi:hypothetical protein